MALTLDSSGTKAATVGTTYTLATSTNNGVFIAEWDLSALVAGENVHLTVGGITLTGGVASNMWSATYTAPLINTRVQCPPVGSDISVNLTLTQLSGTGRSFPWKLLRA